MSTGCSIQRAICCVCANRRRARSTSSSRRSSRGTRRCARIGRSRARPATISPIWFSACWSIHPARTASRRAYTEFTGERRRFRRDRARLQDPHHARMRWRASSTCSPAMRRASLGRTRAPPTSRATSCSGRLKEIVACFPVYRTYVDGAAEPDRSGSARPRLGGGQARRNETDIDPSVFDFLHRLLTDRPGRPAAQRLQPAIGGALRHARAAIQRPGHGQGARGHRLLSLQPLRRAERGRRASRPFRCDAGRVPQGQCAARGALAARHAGHLHSRHQARRGHPRAAGRAVGDAGGMGSAGPGLEPDPARPPRRRRGHGAARSQ